jgi:hypothetical protein
MIQTDIYDVLTGSASVTGIAGSRIYPKRIPQNGQVPAVVYTINDITPVRSLSGESGLDSGIVEIICWAKDYTTAHLLAAAVRSAFVASGIAALTGRFQDVEDKDTRNFGVTMRLNAWSSSSVGATPQNLKDPISELAQTPFTGNGSTVNFTLPKFRAGSVMVFFNGRLAKKGTETDLTAAYYEKSTCDGFIFRTAPKGGDYADELLAFYAKS